MIDESTYPVDGDFTEQATFLLRYATLAPSGHNTQPWLFRIGGHTVDVIADRRRALPVVDPYDRELVISCGAALGTLETAAAHFGFQPRTQLAPDPDDPDLLARVYLSERNERATAATALFAAIETRRTTRTPFNDALPPDAVLARCHELARAGGVSFDIFTDKGERSAIAGLVARGDRVQFDDPAFRRELAAWVHSTRLGSRDGMSGAAFGVPDMLAPVARFVIRTFDIGDGIAAADKEKILSGTPMLGLLSSQNDDQDNWLRTGQALTGILLELTAAGFTASYLNQPIEVVTLRPELKETVGLMGHKLTGHPLTGYPQILLRIGCSETTPPQSVRRDLAEIIL